MEATIQAAIRGRTDDMLIDGQEPDESLTKKGYYRKFVPIYFGELFPYGDIVRWLSYGYDGDKSYISRREFSFTLQETDTSRVYSRRFLSFDCLGQLEWEVANVRPLYIGIGAVYSEIRHAPRGGNLGKLLEKELIFGIDIKAYNHVRYCCKGHDVCPDCWPLMTAAIKVIDMSLRGTFCFNHILWVYNGIGGVSCWVCDRSARRLTSEERAAIVVSLKNCKVSYFEVLKDIFERKLLPSLQAFSTEDRCEKILGIILDESARAEIRRRWQNSGSSSCSDININLVRWEQLKYIVQSGSCKAHGLHRYIEEIVLSFTNPRLDMEVSRQMDHLLMAPFCVHPITARVCVPIDPVHCDEFDPRTVPTLAKLVRELKLRDMDEEWEYYDFFHTSHGKYLSFFRSSFLEPLLKSCKEEMENAAYN